MSATTKSVAWIVASSIATVEALKDQGFARWNHPLRSAYQRSNAKLRSYNSQAVKLSAPSAVGVSKQINEEKLKQSEESLRKVMYLTCWGPN